ncbi:hypothetical protein Tco_0036663, partial [Tanacetum coccineum]
MLKLMKITLVQMDAQTQGRQEYSKEKEESKEECSSKSRKTKKMKIKVAAKIRVIQVKAVEETTSV